MCVVGRQRVWVVGGVGKKGPEQQCQSTGMTGSLQGADGWRSLNARLRRSRLIRKEH